ncbi:hypothetical protein ABID80_002102 [Streptomyces sp. PvP037]
MELERPGAVVCRPLDRTRKSTIPSGAARPSSPTPCLLPTPHCRDGAGGADGGNEDETDARGGVMLRAFVEVDRATKGPERLAAKPSSYARLHSYAPAHVVRQQQQPFPEPGQETWRQRYSLFSRLLFILDNSGPAWVENRINALRAAIRRPELAPFLSDVPVLAAPMTDLLHHGPTAPVWQPVTHPDQRVDWMHTRRLQAPLWSGPWSESDRALRRAARGHRGPGHAPTQQANAKRRHCAAAPPARSPTTLRSPDTKDHTRRSGSEPRTQAKVDVSAPSSARERG